MLCALVQTQYHNVTDRQTDRQTEVAYQWRASVCWCTLNASSSQYTPWLVDRCVSGVLVKSNSLKTLLCVKIKGQTAITDLYGFLANGILLAHGVVAPLYRPINAYTLSVMNNMTWQCYCTPVTSHHQWTEWPADLLALRHDCMDQFQMTIHHWADTVYRSRKQLTVRKITASQRMTWFHCDLASQMIML